MQGATQLLEEGHDKVQLQKEGHHTAQLLEEAQAVVRRRRPYPMWSGGRREAAVEMVAV
jgi:hypothetical protein